MVTSQLSTLHSFSSNWCYPTFRALKTCEDVRQLPSSLADDVEKAEDALLSIETGLPPVPKSLASRIKSGAFVEMSELSPEQLGTLSSETPDKGKSKQWVVCNILVWIHCFGLYTAVVTRKKPEMIPDLIAYQTIIIEAHLEYEGDGWIGYDRCFRQRMVASSSGAWSHIDSTLGVWPL